MGNRPLNNLAALALPPHSVEAEQSLLGALLLDNEAWVRIEGLVDAEDFYRDDHRRIFRHIIKLLEAGLPADLTTVYASIEESKETDQAGGFAYLAEIANNTPSAANIGGYAKTVHERAIKRRIITVADQISASAIGATTVDDLLVNANKAIANVLGSESPQIGSRPGPRDMPEAVGLFTEAMARIESGDAGIKTGMIDLDETIGALLPGDVVVVAGRPAMGKTIFGGSVALNAAHAGKRVLFFSMEMPAAQVINLFAANLTDGLIPPDAMRRGIPEERYSDMMAALETIKNLPIIIDDRTLTPAQMNSAIRMVSADGAKPELIVIDYLQMVPADRPIDNRNNEVGQISRGVKEMAKTFGIPVIVLAQVNRATEDGTDKRPHMKNLRESGAIEQDADMIVFLHREAYYRPDTVGAIEKNALEAIVAKNRFGEQKTVNLYFDGAASKIGNLDRDTQMRLVQQRAIFPSKTKTSGKGKRNEYEG